MKKTKTLHEIPWDYSFIQNLPGRELQSSPKSIQTPGCIYSFVMPEPVQNPELLFWSPSLATEMEIESTPEDAKILSGNKLPSGIKPYALRYGGHQFGSWAGQLGDGRALSLGEYLNSKNKRFEIQLKGAGRTPYSRQGDGRAVLRSSVREFFCSEAMHALHIPTTRALACVTTGESILRDMFYDGNPAYEPGAIVTRVAPSFIRFGNFQILHASGEVDLLEKFTHYVIRTYFPECATKTNIDIFSFFQKIVDSTAHLMVEWMRVGFVHGVMNTDNMSILGLTIDYGPYGWLDVFDPNWTPNTTDEVHKRYRYGAQPERALWNLVMLAESLLGIPHLPEDAEKRFKDILASYESIFNEKFYFMMSEKLGFSQKSQQEVKELYQRLEMLFKEEEWDWTLFFRELAKIHLLDSEEQKNKNKILETIQPAFYGAFFSESSKNQWHNWFKDYLIYIQKDPLLNKMEKMNAVNPYITPRNFLVQTALEELERGNKSYSDRLFLALQTPYLENKITKEFYGKMPQWARNKPGCSALSCSS